MLTDSFILFQVQLVIFSVLQVPSLQMLLKQVSNWKLLCAKVASDPGAEEGVPSSMPGFEASAKDSRCDWSMMSCSFLL